MRASRLSRVVGLVAVLTGFAGGLGAAGAVVVCGGLSPSAVAVSASEVKEPIVSMFDFSWT